jgi:lipopolysaccharide/colanic/teichoic acid biosynthesis glycosyltransferase
MQIPVPTSRAGRKSHLSGWDLLWALVCPALALYLRDAQILTNADLGAVTTFWVISTASTLVALFVFRIHEEMAHYFSIHNTVDIARAVVLAELLTCMALFVLTRLDGIPRSTPLIHGLLLASTLVGTRILIAIIQGEDKSIEGHFRCGRTILIGANRFASFFIKMLNAYSPNQQRVMGVLDERPGMVGRSICGVRILGLPQHLESIIDEFLVHGVRTEHVIIAGEANLLSYDAAREVERVCNDRGIELSFLPRMIGLHGAQPAAADFDVDRDVAIDPTPSPVPAYFALKRCLDVVASLLMLIALLPLIAVVALLVLLDVGTPILFWQRRLGRNGRSFLVYKFRTLRAPFDRQGRPVPDEARLSATGRFLRLTRLDELPQLLNVMTGEMSLIGPRPLLPEDQPENSSLRLSVRPGITGWAQVNGGKLVTREEKQKLDEWYIRNASFTTDLRILIMTVRVVLRTSETSDEAKADVEQVQTRNVVHLARLQSRIAVPEAAARDDSSEPPMTPRAATQ